MLVGIQIERVGRQAEQTQFAVERFDELADLGAAVHGMTIDDEKDRCSTALEEALEKLDEDLSGDVALVAHETQLKSDTHSSLGRRALNTRLTRSSGQGAEASGSVVRTVLPRRASALRCSCQSRGSWSRRPRNVWRFRSRGWRPSTTDSMMSGANVVKRRTSATQPGSSFNERARSFAVGSRPSSSRRC